MKDAYDKSFNKLEQQTALLETIIGLDPVYGNCRESLMFLAEDLHRQIDKKTRKLLKVVKEVQS